MSAFDQIRAAAQLDDDGHFRTLMKQYSEGVRADQREKDRRSGPLWAVLWEVAQERGRQEAKWGVQDMPDGTGPREVGPGQPYYYSTMAEIAKQACDVARDADDRRMSLVLLEEVFEALAEDDPDALAAELVQVAGVAVKWIQMIRRRHTYNGGDRLHGICRCGEGRDHVSHHPVTDRG
jgi:hypothetical protein